MDNFIYINSIIVVVVVVGRALHINYITGGQAAAAVPVSFYRTVLMMVLARMRPSASSQSHVVEAELVVIVVALEGSARHELAASVIVVICGQSIGPRLVVRG